MLAALLVVQVFLEQGGGHQELLRRGTFIMMGAYSGEAEEQIVGCLDIWKRLNLMHAT